MTEEYEQGYQRGWDAACDFIVRHPHGMPWAALPEDPDEEEPKDDFERGQAEGWGERMKDEGWPQSRREVMEESLTPVAEHADEEPPRA
jgi:hypothetical protein